MIFFHSLVWPMKFSCQYFLFNKLFHSDFWILTVLQLLAHLQQPLRSRQWCYSHFTEEETEAQRGSGACLDHTACMWWGWVQEMQIFVIFQGYPAFHCKHGPCVFLHRFPVDSHSRLVLIFLSDFKKTNHYSGDWSWAFKFYYYICTHAIIILGKYLVV